MHWFVRLNWLVGAAMVGCEASDPAPEAPDASMERAADGGIAVASVTCKRGLARPRVLSDGFAREAVVNMWEVVPGAAGWDEEHVLRTYAVAPDEAWSRSGTRLETETPVPDYEPGRNTLFSCDDEAEVGGLLDNPDFGFAARTYDDRGALIDCVMWGEAAPAVRASFAGEPEGDDVTYHNSIRDPSELRGCRVL
jgi:hypothetical protein